MIAAGTVGLLLALLVAGFVINAYGQISGNFVYQIPLELMEIIKAAVTSSLWILGVGGVIALRKWGERDVQKDDSEPIDVVLLPDSEPSAGKCIKSDKRSSESPKSTSEDW